MTTAVVFGGSGFIGAHLAAALVGRQESVHVADLVAPEPHPSVRFHRVDVREVIPDSLPVPDVVYNLAAVHRTPGHDDHEYYDTNVAGALNVTEWCDRHDVREVVFTSSISVYGPSEEPKHETSATAPNSAYGRSKLLAEQVHLSWQARDERRRLVVARPAVVFGRGEHGNFTRLAGALRRRRFAYPGRTDTVKACIFVADLVDSLLFARELRLPTALYNACYPRDYTIGEICQAFHDVAGFALPRTVPPTAMRLALATLAAGPARDRTSSLHPDRVRKLTASTRIVPQVLVEAGFPWRHDLEAALREWAHDDFA